ncbi:MAG TPA: DUF4364 family protein [Tissierellia bacterium]|nr:DUF4364 family protein [Tissierellia bacterium]
MFFENTEDLAQNKLLLLYIIDKSDNSLSNNEITELVLKHNYMNYFMVQQYLSELVTSGFIEYKGHKDRKVYNLLEKGKTALTYFEKRIPDDIRKQILKLFSKDAEKKNKSTHIVGDYYKKSNNEYTVNLKLIENAETLLSLYLSVPSKKQAEKICQVWKDKTEYIYKNLLNILFDDDITSF